MLTARKGILAPGGRHFNFAFLATLVCRDHPGAPSAHYLQTNNGDVTQTTLVRLKIGASSIFPKQYIYFCGLKTFYHKTFIEMGTLWVFCFEGVLAPCPDWRRWKAAETQDQIMILSSGPRFADAEKLAPALRSQEIQRNVK